MGCYQRGFMVGQQTKKPELSCLHIRRHLSQCMSTMIHSCGGTLTIVSNWPTYPLVSACCLGSPRHFPIWVSPTPCCSLPTQSPSFRTTSTKLCTKSKAIWMSTAEWTSTRGATNGKEHFNQSPEVSTLLYKRWCLPRNNSNITSMKFGLTSTTKVSSPRSQ